MRRVRDYGVLPGLVQAQLDAVDIGAGVDCYLRMDDDTYYALIALAVPEDAVGVRLVAPYLDALLLDQVEEGLHDAHVDRGHEGVLCGKHTGVAPELRWCREVGLMAVAACELADTALLQTDLGIVNVDQCSRPPAG